MVGGEFSLKNGKRTKYCNVRSVEYLFTGITKCYNMATCGIVNIIIFEG
jgi:hypothetical protein